MKSRLSLISLAVCALALPVVGHAEDKHTQDRAHPVTFVKDSAITASVKTKLAADKVTSATKIHVDTDADGVVYLTGTARSQAEIDKAVAIARDTDSVRSVKNELKIKPQ